MFQWISFIGIQKIVLLIVITQTMFLRHYFRRVTEVEILVVGNT